MNYSMPLSFAEKTPNPLGVSEQPTPSFTILQMIDFFKDYQPLITNQKGHQKMEIRKTDHLSISLSISPESGLFNLPTVCDGHRCQSHDGAVAWERIPDVLVSGQGLPGGCTCTTARCTNPPFEMYPKMFLKMFGNLFWSFLCLSQATHQQFLATNCPTASVACIVGHGAINRRHLFDSAILRMALHVGLSSRCARRNEADGSNHLCLRVLSTTMKL